MYPWYRDSVAAAAAAGLGGPVGVVGSGFCSTGPGQGGTTIKTESGYSDCMLALDYVQSKVFDAFIYSSVRLTHYTVWLQFLLDFQTSCSLAAQTVSEVSKVLCYHVTTIESENRVQCQHETRILHVRLTINI